MRCSNVVLSLSYLFSRGVVREPAETPMSETPQVTRPLRTPLHGFHVERGARLVTFAGYEMPVQYPTGILTEHLHIRIAAGLLDVSHMWQISILSVS